VSITLRKKWRWCGAGQSDSGCCGWTPPSRCSGGTHLLPLYQENKVRGNVTSQKQLKYGKTEYIAALNHLQCLNYNLYIEWSTYDCSGSPSICCYTSAGFVEIDKRSERARNGLAAELSLKCAERLIKVKLSC